ncbi:MAG: B12-binding domain-containing radical SAM protein [Methylobacter sp.]
MRVLFVYTNVNGFHENCYSPGLAYVVSSTRANGHITELVIIRSKEDYLLAIKEVENFKPHVVGFSAVSSQFGVVKEIAALIKKHDENIITVCGGVHPTIYPNCILEAKSLDGIFIGESEIAFVEFLHKLENSIPYNTTDNFAYVFENKLIRNKLKPLIIDLDVLPYPDKDVYSYQEAVREAGAAPFFFSRGCPYLCTYCCNHAIANAYNLNHNKTRYRSAKSSVNEIEDALAIYPMETITIRDDIFGLNKKWCRDFCSEYKIRIGKPFSVFSRVDVVNEEYVQQLKEAGCSRITFAIESGNEYMLNEIMNRNLSINQMIKAFDLVNRAGLQTTAINLIGIPGETEDMIWDTIKLNRIVNPTTSRVNIFYPYKGTVLGDKCFTDKLVLEDIYEDFYNERRDSVLNFSAEYKAKLIYVREHWESLVYGDLNSLVV